MSSTLPTWRTHRVFAWWCLTGGIGLGLILGLWSFYGPVPVPEWLGDYDSIPRRLVRLGHIALIALSLIHLLLVRELEGCALSPGRVRLAARCMAFGNIALPLTLFGAAFAPPLQYAMSLPAIAVFVAVLLGARAAAAGKSTAERSTAETSTAERKTQ